MRIPSALVTSFILFASLLFTNPVLATEIGKPAPALIATDATGHAVDLASYRGKVVYLDFWASWCGPCRKSFPWMNSLAQRHAKAGLVVIGVNVDAQREAANEFLQSNPAKFNVVYDAKGESPQAYGVIGMPTSYIIDRDGVLRLAHAGFNDKSAAELEAAVSAALKAGK